MEKIKDVSLVKKVRASMKQYGTEVNEARAIPEFYDGLKPVQRKVLWAMHKLNLDSPTKLVKTARLVGDVLGKYHPHGDKSVQDAVAILVNQPTSPIYGEGNWGSITGDSPAAMRYTLVRLSDYGRQFFDPYYLPVLDHVPNYDGSEQEPVRLFPPLPQLLLNGSSGIGVGVTCEIPSFTKDSLVKVLINAIENKGATPESCLDLEYATLCNSQVVKTTQKRNLLEFYNTGRGSVQHKSRLSVKNGITLTGIAPFQGVDAYMKKALTIDLPEISEINDKSTQWKLCIEYTLKRGADVDKVKLLLSQKLASVKHYKINVTERTLKDENGWREVIAQFSPSSIPEIINKWLEARIALEVKAAEWHIVQMDTSIRKNELLRIACANRDFIFSLAKSKDDNNVVKQKIQTQLKCSKEEAEFVFEMKWRNLRNLEDEQIRLKIIEQEKQKKLLVGRKQNPKKHVAGLLAKM